MNSETVIRDAILGYSRVRAMDPNRTEVRMSANTGEAIWNQMIAVGAPWPDDGLIWDESKLDDARLFGLRVRRDDSVPDGEVQYWTRR